MVIDIYNWSIHCLKSKFLQTFWLISLWSRNNGHLCSTIYKKKKKRETYCSIKKYLTGNTGAHWWFGGGLFLFFLFYCFVFLSTEAEYITEPYHKIFNGFYSVYLPRSIWSAMTSAIIKRTLYIYFVKLFTKEPSPNISL